MQKNTIIVLGASIALLVACGGGVDGEDAGGALGDGASAPPGEGGSPDGGLARFSVNVTLAGDGGGAVFSDDGAIACGDGMTECRVTVPAGTELTLSASPIEPARFAGWSGRGVDCMGADTCTLTVTGDVDVNATFTIHEVALLVSAVGDGRGTIVSEPVGIDCGATCSASFPGGAMVRLRATPEVGSEFTGWSGACAGLDEVCAVRLDDVTEVMGEFTLRRFTVEVEHAGDGLGTVTSDPAGLDCGETCAADFGYGTRVTLAAVPAPGSSFAGWTGCDAPGPSCEVTVTDARRVEARFETNRHALALALAGAGAGVVRSDPAGIDCGADCDETLLHGTVVTLTAIPDAGSSFDGWGGACASATGATCIVTMTEARAVTATFALRDWDLSVTLAGTGRGRVASSPGALDCGTRCDEAFEHGTIVTLTAVEDASSTFAGWGGACSGAAATCTVSMTEARTVTATFALGARELSVTPVGTGAGSVTSAPAGIDCGADCSEDFDHGTVVTLTAHPDSSSTFDGWSGACSGAGLTCTITVTGPLAVSASFTLRPRTLTVVTNGTGNGTVASAPEGIACGADCAEDYPHGTSVTLTATASAADSRFVGWSGACSGSRGTCTVSMTAAASVTATFALLGRDLTIARDGTGAGVVTSSPEGIDCGAECATSFAHGTLVVLTATPDAATSSFAGWAGACSGTSRTCALSMTAARDARATFTLLPRALSVALAGSGEGSVTSSPGGIACGADCTEDYAHGTTVVLTAAPNPGTSSFAGWTGACSGAALTCSVSMTEARAVTATFARLPRTLDVEIAGTGAGTVTSSPAGIACRGDCTEDYAHGTVVELTARPAPGSVFDGWTGACSGPTCSIEMTAARRAVATFTLTRHAVRVTVGGTGAGTVTSSPAGIDCGRDCEETYDYGTPVVLTARPATGSVFASWGGACAGTAGPSCTVSVAAAAAVTATFDITQRRLTVTRAGAGAGTVTSVPAGIACAPDCDEDLAYGTAVTLTAAADGATSRFAGWGGACSGAATTCSVSMTEARGVTATFELLGRRLDVSVTGSGAGRVTSSPSGIDCGTDCDQDFAHGTPVTLTAAPDTATSRFAGWSGACAGTDLTCSVAMSAARSVSARFEPLARRLDVTPAGTGTGRVTSAPAGIDCGSDCSEDYAHGTPVTLTAAPDGATSRFAGWSGACTTTATTCSVTMSAARSVTARFELLARRLDVSVTGPGAGRVTSAPAGIDCGADCDQEYPHGTPVTLTAAPDTTSSRFAGWSGYCSGASTTCAVPMSAARSVIARFELLPRRLDVTRNGTGAGTVTSVPAGIDCGTDCFEDYPHGENVTLTARPSTGSSFGGWTGASCPGTTCVVPMTFARTVTATFTTIRHPLTVGDASTSGGGTVTSSPGSLSCPGSCTETFDYGTPVTLTARPSPGSAFVSWGGDCAGTATTCSVSMTQARNAITTFRITRHRLSVANGGTGRGVVQSSSPGIDCGTDCDETYDWGTPVTLNALPDTGTSRFVAWTGACSGTVGTVCTVSMTEARTAGATFDLLPRRLDVTRTGRGAGTVTSDVPGIACGADCAEDYPHGTRVTLTATLDSRVTVFGGWGGACSGTALSCTVAMTDARSVTARFDLVRVPLTVRPLGTGTGVVTSDVAGIDCGADCEESYEYGTTVTLTARPHPGMVFTGWLGDCTGTGTCTTSMTGSREVAANFEITTRQLDVGRSGSGNVYSDPSGISCGRSCSRAFDYGTRVRLYALPADGWRFDRWEGPTCLEGTQTASTCTTDMTEDRRATAVFIRTHYTLWVTGPDGSNGTVVSSPSGISCQSDCVELYPIGTRVRLTARTAGGNSFFGWTGAPGCGRDRICDVVMDADRVVDADMRIP